MSYISDLIDSFTSCLTCFQSPALRINNRKFRILKLLGEGGFSYVYLVQDTRTDQLYALKKIRCPFGQESVQAAIREVDAYKLFKSDYIIKAIDSSVVQEKEGSKTVYILLPYFERGNLQDKINDHLIGGTYYTESELIPLIIDIAKGILMMHKYRTSTITNTRGGGGSGTNRSGGISTREALLDRMDSSRSSHSSHTRRGGGVIIEDDNNINNNETVNDSNNNNDEEERGLLQNQEDTNFDQSGTALGEIIPYAHRDIKPANIMINHITGKPVLMDLGSCFRARIHLRTRQQALELQDLAAEHCTLPYRAPELFDVKTDSSIDERVDIWSLGCTIFALMYSASPFEMQASETGASLNMAIINGQYKFPTTPEYSDGLKSLVSRCLTVSPTERPFIDEVIEASQALIVS